MHLSTALALVEFTLRMILSELNQSEKGRKEEIYLPHVFTFEPMCGHTKTSQHKPAHASTRQHVHFALFSGFFCIRILVKVFPTFYVKISAKSITVNEILRIF